MNPTTTNFTALRAACTGQATIATPLGTMLLARTSKGLAGAWFDGQKHHPGALHAEVLPNDPLLAEAAAQLDDFLTDADRPRRSFDLPLDLLGTPFQQAVWQALLAIETGRTRSYGAIAVAIGSAAAVRAVGAAVGRNPVSVIVPCHRVVGSSGALTGYAGGLERKEALLALEAGRDGAARH